MVNRKFAVLAVVLALTLLVAPGCVTKKLFRNNIDDTDGRVAAVENAIEDNARRITDLASDTDGKISSVRATAEEASKMGKKAMGEATAAREAAQGKLIWSVTLSDDKVKFDFGRAQLTSGGISALESLVSKIKSYGKQLYVEVEGHTDSVGGESFNLDLGEQRAMAVRNYLNQTGGLPLHMMNTISYGESRPVADNSSRAGRAENRRVVVRVLE